VPHALHVAFRRSDQSHARIVSIDTEAASAMPGVVPIVTAEDLDLPPVRAVSRIKDCHATDIHPLARGKVRFVGEPVVAVLAESRYPAEDAPELVEIDDEALPRVTDPMETMAEGAPISTRRQAPSSPAASSSGDVDAVIADALVPISHDASEPEIAYRLADAACAIVGAPGADLGEVPILFVVPTDVAALEPEALLAHCRAHLSSYKVPAEIRLVAEMPRTGFGKIMRFRLRERL
jgi:hypothetical protein